MLKGGTMMLPEDKYFNTLSNNEVWERYCGFLDLSIEEFMEMQKELLMDEIERVADSTLGRKIMNNRKPKSVAEFRRIVPLTTYQDYEPYLSEKQEDALAISPLYWCHSTGRGGQFKWIPHSAEFADRAVRNFLGTFLLGSARGKGELNVAPGFQFLIMLPPPPYASGCLVQQLAQRFSFTAIPSAKMVKNLEFEERVHKGFQIALRDGVEVIAGIGSILVKVGEEFGGKARRQPFSLSMLHPKVLSRLIKAILRSKREKRGMLPKDLWPVKAILTGGVDTSIYKDALTYYWGVEPFEFYICSEAFYLAMQGWNKKGMFFIPDTAFLEFIPYEEQLKQQDNQDYQPSTVLLDEVEEGKLYEVVITHFFGMPLLRYRMNDIIKVVALKDNKIGVNLPQIVFQRRLHESIHLAGLAELDEKAIWQAISNTGIKYTDWSACKEYDQNQSFLRIYLELKEKKEADVVANLIDEQLRIVDTDYKDIDAYLKLQPVRVTLLSPGTFQRYMDEKKGEGVDRAHMKPSHINPPRTDIKHLCEVSESIRG
jgi:hypothetical protein